jgi:hypothetical protein
MVLVLNQVLALVPVDIQENHVNIQFAMIYQQQDQLFALVTVHVPVQITVLALLIMLDPTVKIIYAMERIIQIVKYVHLEVHVALQTLVHAIQDTPEMNVNTFNATI